MKKNIVVILWSISVLAALFIGQALNDPVSFTDTSEEQIFRPEPPVVTVEPVEVQKPKQDVSETSPKMESQPQKTKIVKTPVTVGNVISDLVNHFEKMNHNNFDNYRHMADTWEKLKELDEDQLLEVYEQINSENEKGVNW